MEDHRVALGQISPRLGDLRANLDLHVETAERAGGQDADLLVFPELSLTGYLLRDQVAELAIRADDPALSPLLEASRTIDMVVGFAEASADHRFHNAAAYLSGGRVVHVHRKLYLPTYGMFEEGRDFGPGEQLRPFDSGRATCGLLICEDLWHPTSAWLLAQEGAEILLVLSNGPTRGARDGEVTSVNVWRTLLQFTAQFQTSWVVYVNRSGCEDGLVFGGGSMVVDPFGRVTGELEPLEPGLLALDLGAEVLRRARTAYPLLRDENLELVYRELGRIRRKRFDLPDEPETD